MKYSDQQRIEKMRETTEKLLRYVEKENITPEIIFAEEAVQWTATTLESTLLIYQRTSRSNIRIFHG